MLPPPLNPVAMPLTEVDPTLLTVPLKVVGPLIVYELSVILGPVQIVAALEMMAPAAPHWGVPVLAGKFRLPLACTTTSAPLW